MKPVWCWAVLVSIIFKSVHRIGISKQPSGCLIFGVAFRPINEPESAGWLGHVPSELTVVIALGLSEGFVKTYWEILASLLPVAARPVLTFESEHQQACKDFNKLTRLDIAKWFHSLMRGNLFE
jgi:hypothetical protein